MSLHHFPRSEIGGIERVAGTPDEEWLERMFPIQEFLASIGFGAQFILYTACVLRLLSRQPKMMRAHWIMLIHLTLLCSTNILWLASTTTSYYITFIRNRDYPGGPNAFIHNGGDQIPSIKMHLVAYVTGNILADAMLLWRCSVIWKMSAFRSRFIRVYVLVIPSILFTASMVLSILFSIETTAKEGSALYAASSGSHFAVPYIAISLTLNILLTALIIARMIIHQRSMGAFSSAANARPYRVISVMFLESAALNAIVAICQLVTFGIQNPYQAFFTNIASSTQVIANYLIAYRVLDGTAWGASRAENDITTFKAAPGHAHSHPLDTIGTTGRDAHAAPGVDFPTVSDDSRAEMLVNGRDDLQEGSSREFHKAHHSTLSV